MLRNGLKNLLVDLLLFSPSFLSLLFVDRDELASYFQIIMVVFLITELSFLFLRYARGVLLLPAAAACVAMLSHLLQTNRRIYYWDFPQYHCIRALEMAVAMHLAVLLIQTLNRRRRAPWLAALENALLWAVRGARYIAIPILLLGRGLSVIVENNGVYEGELRLYWLSMIMIRWLLVIAPACAALGQSVWLWKKARRMERTWVVELPVRYFLFPYRPPSLANFLVSSDDRLHSWRENLSFSTKPFLMKFERGRIVSLYSPSVYAEAARRRDTVLVVSWNSRRDRRLPLWARRRLLSHLKTAQAWGWRIVVRDGYLGERDYASGHALGRQLLRFPYYRMGSMTNLRRVIQEEVAPGDAARKQALRSLLSDCAARAARQKDPALSEIARQLSGGSAELIRYFYALMKLCEYVIHTEALSALCAGTALPLPAERLEAPSLGDFVELLPTREVYEGEAYLEAIRSLRFLDTAALRNGKTAIRTRRVSHPDACQVLCRLRRRFIGHGTMVYAVSEEMVEHLARVALLMLERHERIRGALTLDGSFPLGGRAVPAAIRRRGRRLYYNGQLSDNTYLYLDYVTGNTRYLHLERTGQAHKLRVGTVRTLEG